MPIYEYECVICGKVVEHECKASKKPLVIKCECYIDGIMPSLMRPIISRSSFVINGFNEKNGYSGGTQ